MFALPDDSLDNSDLPRRQTPAGRQVYPRLDPELGLAFSGLHVHVHPAFFSREEEESVAHFEEDG